MHLSQPFCLPPALRRALVHLNPPTPGGVRQPGRAWWVLAVGAWLVLLGTVAPALAQSTDATLSGLTVSPTNITGFDAATTEYAVGVANNVTQATVTPTASDTGATITIDGTTVTSGSGHTVTLVDGSNVVSIVVTAADTTAPQKTYTVSINRESTEPYGWKVLDDFNHPILADLDRDYFRDITSDGTTMWVASRDDDDPATVFAFDMQTKARASGKDLVTDGANSNPWGLWTKDQTMWVADPNFPHEVFTYTFDPDDSDWERASRFDLGTGNTKSTGMWSDGQTLWVANEQRIATDDPKIFAYTLDGDRETDLDFNTLEDADNTRPKGLWSDGETMWVADSSDKKIYAYDMLTKAHVPAKDFSPKDMDKFDHEVWGIWSDYQTMWVENPNKGTGFIRSYVMPVSDGTRLRLVRINGKKIDLTPASPTHYVADTETQVTVEAEALHFQAQAAITSHDDADTSAEGHQVALSGSSTDITITVTAQDGANTDMHTVTVTKVTPPGQPTGLALTAAHESLTVTWTAPTPTGTLDITAYEVRYRRTGKSWKTKRRSGGTLSYRIRSLDNDKEYEVQVRAVINDVPGQWSDSATGTPEAASGNNNLQTLSVIIGGEEQIESFDPATISYTVGVASTVTQATISATVEHDDASIDGDDLREVDLRPGGNTFTITVEAENDEEKDYTVTINRASTATWGWKVLTDIELSETTAPRGIWSDGTILWVADDDDDNLEAYDLATGAHKEDRDIDLDATNNDPQDIWSDGETMWVVEFSDPAKVFAYDLATGDRKEDRDIDDLDPAQMTAQNIWSDGETIWVKAHDSSKLYAYDLATGDREDGRDIPLDSAGDQGMWSDGETLWMPSGSGDGVMVPYLLFAPELTIDAGDSQRSGRCERQSLGRLVRH